MEMQEANTIICNLSIVCGFTGELLKYQDRMINITSQEHLDKRKSTWIELCCHMRQSFCII